MELPYHLTTLAPLSGALDILRYLGSISAPNADSDEICDALDLTDRTFGKAIRRLVTKGYVAMDGELIYRLSNQGREAVEILREYDAANPQAPASTRRDASVVTRRLVVAMPPTLVAGEPGTLAVGLDGATDEETGVLYSPADMVVRVSVVNGDPAKPQEAVLKLSNYPVKHAFSITPGAYQQMRVRVQVFQLGPNPDDINVAGGLYVDAGVTRQAAAATAAPIAYGSDIQIQVLD
jgi:DNA-binding MarR family transcriptional regulator